MGGVRGAGEDIQANTAHLRLVTLLGNAYLSAPATRLVHHGVAHVQAEG